MRLYLQLLGATALLVGALRAVPALAAPAPPDPAAVRRAEQAVESLRGELARVNAEIAALKRGSRTLRSDYRLLERMADAEALALKLTAAEARLRAQAGEGARSPAGAPVVASPQASPQDGSVELEAKADLLTDQAKKLEGEASTLARAAEQMRSRKALRRKAGSWERDPFTGLETSKRSVAAAAVRTTGGPTAGSSEGADRGPTGGGAASDPTKSTNGEGTWAPPPAAIGSGSPTAGVDTAAKGPGLAATSDSAAASKAPLFSAGATDRQAVEQRLFLDPATAAELRQALGGGGVALDPEALERGASALRAKARLLEAQAHALRARIRVP